MFQQHKIRALKKQSNYLKLVTVYLLTITLGAELAARVVVYFRTPKINLSGRALYVADSILGYRLIPGKSTPTVTINNNGFRGADFLPQKPAGIIRIVCMGNSITFGQEASSDSTTYPFLLNKELNGLPSLRKRVEVLNCAVSGYNSFQSLEELQLQILPYHPDVIILCLGWNDIIMAKQIGWHKQIYGPNRDYLSLSDSFALWLIKYKLLHLPAGVSQARLRQFVNNLEEFGTICKTNGVTLMLLDPPTILSDKMNDSERKKFTKSTFVPGEESLFVTYRGSFVEFARRHDYRILDSGLALDVSGKDSFIVDNCHPNDLGYRRMATTLVPQVLNAVSEDRGID
ncbi:MAG: SGNH/GDSL hydrolase family protein [Bacteroidota bacterium]